MIHTNNGTSPNMLPTPGFFHSVPGTPSIRSTIPPDHVDEDCSSLCSNSPQPNKLPLLQLASWNEERTYDEQPPSCIHYSIEWKVALNNRVVAGDTEQDLVLAPSTYWQQSLKAKLESLLCKKFTRNRGPRTFRKI